MFDDTLIDRIYEAALVPELWPHVLTDISLSAGFRGGFVFAVRDGYVNATGSAELMPLYDEFVAGGWDKQDLRLPRAAASEHQGFLTDHDLLTEEEIAADHVYENFYRKNDIGFVAGTVVKNPNGDSVAIAFERNQKLGPVSRPIVASLDRLRPHLARASMLSSRLSFERARAQSQALQAIGLAAGVLSRRGQLLAANGLLNSVIPNLIQDRALRAVFSDSRADALFAAALSDLSSNRVVIARSIPIAASSNQVPVIVHIVPIRGAAHDVFAEANVLLVLMPVDRSNVPAADLIQGLFDLTPAEARIARGVSRGETVDGIAITTNVSRETVRSQLKSVLTKTGLSRQQELVNLLAGKAMPLGGSRQ